MLTLAGPPNINYTQRVNDSACNLPTIPKEISNIGLNSSGSSKRSMMAFKEIVSFVNIMPGRTSSAWDRTQQRNIFPLQFSSIRECFVFCAFFSPHILAFGASQHPA
eukprot:8313390-Pyramimonas_sp.AAC.1